MSVVAIVEDDLRLSLPQFFCCNCGEAEEIRPVATPLSEARTMSWSRGLSLQLELPYCRRCVNSATRRPVGLMKKLLIAGLLAVSVGAVAMITPLGTIGGALAFYLTVGIVFAIVFGCFALQKPRGRQTSYHQPVRLVEVRKQPSRKVAALTLSFTHTRYARAFASANSEAIARGALELIGG